MQRMLLSVMLVVGIIVPNQLPAAIAPSETPDERELIAIEHKWCEAYLTSDADYLDAVMSSTYVQTNVRGEVTTKAQEVAEVRNHIIAYEKFETSDLNVKIYGDAAVVTGQTYIKAVVKASGRRIDATIRITDTFVRQQGKWQIVASQTTLLPKLRG